MTTTVHPFESAGLGIAPFKFVGFHVAKYQACYGAPVQPGASCDYCGTGIMNVFEIRSSDDKQFHVGCDCVYKTFIKTDALVKEVKGAQRAHLREIHAVARTAHREKAALSRRLRFLSENEGIEQALTCEHAISQDLAGQLARYGSLSANQVALAFKLYAQAYGPQKVEVNVPAPEGKVVVTGKVVSAKWYEGTYGSTLKMTVSVVTDAGTWLAWGTVPESLKTFERANPDLAGALKGKEVTFKATLTRGRDAHFALFKRPTQARFVAELA